MLTSRDQEVVEGGDESPWCLTQMYGAQSGFRLRQHRRWHHIMRSQDLVEFAPGLGAQLSIVAAFDLTHYFTCQSKATDKCGIGHSRTPLEQRPFYIQKIAKTTERAVSEQVLFNM